MKNLTMMMLLTMVCSLSQAPRAGAQNSAADLNKVIVNQSGTLGALTKDLGPDLGNIEGIAKQLGDANLAKQIDQVHSSGQGLSGGSNLVNEMSALAKQVHNIPGISEILGGFNGSLFTFAGPRQKFNKPPVVSSLLHKPTAAVGNALPASGGILPEVAIVSQLLGSSSAGQSAACQSELDQAGAIMPQAIKNLQMENRAYKQLLSE